MCLLINRILSSSAGPASWTGIVDPVLRIVLRAPADCVVCGIVNGAWTKITSAVSLDNRVSQEHQLSKSSPPTPKIFSIWEIMTQHEVSSNLKIFQRTIKDSKVAHSGENLLKIANFLKCGKLLFFIG